MTLRKLLVAVVGLFLASAALALPSRYGLSHGWPMGGGQAGVTVSPLAISGTPDAATQNVAYAWTPAVSGGSGTRSFALTGAALPTGLSLASATGTISGAPTVLQTVSGIAITVTDSSGSATLSGLTIVVSAPSNTFYVLKEDGGKILLETSGAVLTQASATPPSNLAAPSISGRPIIAQTLTASPGSWDQSPTSYAYQWQYSDGTAIAGATGSTYIVTSADLGLRIKVQVTASNALGSATDASGATSPVTDGSVSSSPIALPSGATHFWGLMKRAGYSGSAIRIQRDSDNAQQDCGFDVNQMVSETCITAFVGSGNGYVMKAYDQVGAVDQVAASAASAPYIVQAGVVVKNASGLIAMRGALEGRYLAAAGAFTAMQGQDFSITAIAQNNVAYSAPTSNLSTPIVGVSTAAGSTTQREMLLMGARSSATARYVVTDFASASGSEIAGSSIPLPAQTTNLVTANVQSAALSGGPGAGSTLFFDRNGGTLVDSAGQSPAAFTTATDVRIFGFPNGAWSTNSANGADGTVTLIYLGAAMNDADRQSLEGQIYNKAAAVLLAASGTALPSLGANGEAFDFTQFAALLVPGATGKVDLNFSQHDASSWSLGSPPNGIAGLREVSPSSSNTANKADVNFRGSNNFGYDQTTFTAVVMFTLSTSQLTASYLPGIFGHGTVTLGTNSPSPNSAWSFNKDHSGLVAHANDNSLGTTSDYTNMMSGSTNAGQPVYWAYSGFGGGAMIAPNVPSHDNIVAPSNHPPFYSKKKFLDFNQTTDGQEFPGASVTANGLGNVTVMMVMRHKPHPNYRPAEAYNSANNVLWRNKAYIEVDAAIVGGLDGFKKFYGSKSVYPWTAATAIEPSNSAFTQCGDEYCLLGTFDGWLHAAEFFGGQYLTDAQVQALFLNGTNLSAIQ